MEMKKKSRAFRILILFLFLFIGGASCIYYNFYKTWIPLAIVFLYGGILFIILKPYSVDLSETEKNSSYFLGFLFTIFALFDFSIKTGFRVEFDFLFRNLSIALSTSVLGLIIRQILVGLSVPEEDYAQTFRKMKTQLQESFEHFNKAQSIVLGFVEDYAKARKSNQERKEKLSDEYIEKISDEQFSEMEKEYPDKIEKVFQSFSSYYVEDFETTIDQILPASYKTEISDRLKKLLDDYRDALKKNTQDLISSLSRHSGENQERDFIEESEGQIIQLKREMKTIHELLFQFSDLVNSRLPSNSK